MQLSAADILIIVLGAALGGFANGLTGFGTALTAVPIWVQVVPPAFATGLAAAASVVAQAKSMPVIWHSIEWRRIGHIVVAGLLGVPLGTWLLPLVAPRPFKLGVGVVLVAYCAFVLLLNRLPRLSFSPRVERIGDVLIGLGGGIMGGLSGLSGPLPIAWATFKPWTRDQKRALFQVYNSTILGFTLISSLIAGLLPGWFWQVLLLTVPGTFAGVWAGTWLYARLDDRRFDKVVLGLLMLMGVTLIVANV